jgi:hypothetical protein
MASATPDRASVDYYDPTRSGQTSSTASVLQESIRDLEKEDVASLEDQDDKPAQDEPEQSPSSTEKAAPPNPMDPSSFPDGGLRAWLVVLGGFCSLIVSFGMHPPFKLTTTRKLSFPLTITP